MIFDKMKIWPKAIIVFFFLFLIPMVIIGTSVYWEGRKTITQNFGLGLKQLAQQSITAIDRSLFDVHRDMGVWSQLELMQEVLTDDLDGKISSFLKGLFDEYKQFFVINVLNSQGRIIASSDPASVGEDFRESDGFQKAMEGGGYWGDAGVDQPGMAGSVVFAYPIRSHSEPKKVAGVLWACWRTDEISNVLQFSQDAGEEKNYDDFLVGRADGLLIFSSRTGRQDIFRKNLFETKQGSILSTQMGQSGYFIGDSFDENGKKSIIGYSFSSGYRDFPGLGWFVLAQQDSKIALHSVERFGILIFGMGSVIFVFVGFAMAAALGRMAKPIMDLSMTAQDVAHGNLEGKVNYPGHDEIGALVRSFNQMTEDLKAQRSQLVEKQYVDAIITSLSDVLIVTDFDGMIKTVNGAALSLLGYEEKELAGKPFRIVLGEEPWQKDVKGGYFFNLMFDKLRQGETVQGVELTYMTKSGGQIPVDFSASVMQGSSGAGRSQMKPGMANFQLSVVSVARDMRHVKKILDDLKEAKSSLEQSFGMLEERVQERTADLQKSQAAMLNLMEDLVESKDQLQESNAAMEKAKKELEDFSQGLEEKIKSRTYELSVLNEISSAISYTLDHQTLFRLVMESLYQIVDYDICASILFDVYAADITIKPANSSCVKFVDGIKNSIIDAALILTGEDVRKKPTNPFVLFPDPQAMASEEVDEIRSFFNVPFMVQGQIIGIINVSSHRENAFGANDVRLMYTIASQAAAAIERLRSVIAAEKSKMESMVESMSEGVIMLDVRGEVVVMNPRVRQMLNFGKNADVRRPDLERKLHSVHLYSALEECRAKKEIVFRDITIPGKTPEQNRAMRCDVSLVRNDKDVMIGMAIILRDVTKEKEGERLKTEFISTVSHELRTPLSISTEGINLVLDGISGSVNEQQKDLLQTAKDNLGRLNTIITDLLDISKIEAGKVRLKQGLVDFRALIANYTDVYQKVLATKKQTIQTKLPEESVLLYIDRDKIIQVLTNLLNNAHKFTPEGGNIVVFLQTREGEILCSIKDNGVGIAPEDMPRMFGKFEQFGRTHGPGIKGTGLGLAISKALVELHGGKIWAESQPQQGTTFHFTLPSYETVKADFDAQMESIIDAAQTERYPVSLIVINLTNHETIRTRYGEKMLVDIMDTIAGAVSGIITRQADRFLLYEVHTIYIVLPETNKVGGLMVVKRLKDAVAGCHFQIEDKGDLEIKFGVAVYPLDAKEEKDLRRIAIEDTTRKRRVLVVDDNPEIFQLLRLNLEDQRVELQMAEDGEKALEVIAGRIPDLIILDITLPKMNGYELLGRLREDAQTALIPVIILTAKEKGVVEREYKGLGNVPVVGKTEGFEKLAKLVEEMI